MIENYDLNDTYCDHFGIEIVFRRDAAIQKSDLK